MRKMKELRAEKKEISSGGRAWSRSAKDLAAVSLMTALLIAGQTALSAVAGVEVVTVLLLAFSWSFGAGKGMLSATAFSLLRCILFGFFPSVVVLYLVYYNLFALFFGLVRKKSPHLALVVCFAVAFTACFTLLDDLIYPLFAGLSGRAWEMYVYFSLPVMGVQCLCTLITVSLLFYPLTKAFDTAKRGIVR